MKKLLFLLLSLAVTAGASAGVDLKKYTTNQLPVAKAKQFRPIRANSVSLANAGKMATEKVQPIDKFMFKASKKRAIPKYEMFKAPITEQPEGEVKYYKRTGGTAMWYSNGILTGNQADAGFPIEIVYAPDASTVYIKNILVNSVNEYGDTWVEGTLQDNEIHVPLGQSFYYSDYYQADIVLGWGSSYVADGSLEFYPMKTVTEAVYVINGDVITLQNTQPGDTEREGIGLTAYWSDDDTWEYVMEWNTEFTEFVPEVPTVITTEEMMPMIQAGGYLLPYNRTGNAIIPYSSSEVVDEDQGGATYVYFTEDMSEVYMYNPVYNASTGAWVKGTFDGSKITIPLGQYLMWDEDELIGYKTAWGSLTETDEGIGFTVDETVNAITYTMDMETLTISLDNSSENTGLAIIDDNNGWTGFINWNTVYYIMPDVPEELAAEPTKTTADVTWTDEFDSQWNLRYRKVAPGNIYFWDFEEVQASDNALPSGWTTIDADGDGYAWYHLNTPASEGGSWNCHSGDGHLTSASYMGGILTPDNWLVSPQVTLNGQLSFWAAGQDPNYPAEVFAVYVSTGDPTDVDSFVKISDDITATGEVTQYTFDLSSYADQTGYVAIRHYNISDMFRLNIDDIVIGDPSFNPEEYEWVYVNDLSETAYTIEGLTPGTEYEVQVQSFNEGGASDWTEPVYFTTLAETTDLYIMGEVNEQGWAADAGTLMAYDEETKVYTATVNIDGRGQEQENYFSFTTKLGANADDWATIAPYRIGAVSEGSFWVTEDQLNKELGISYQTEPNAFRILGGEYKITVSLENMNVIIEKLGGPAIMFGDVNRDGFVSISDVTTLIDHLLSSDLEESDSFSPDAADINEDGSISISDVSALIDKLLAGEFEE